MNGLPATRCLLLALLILTPPWSGCSSTTPTDGDTDDLPPSCSASEARQCGDALTSAQELLDTHAACSARIALFARR